MKPKIEIMAALSLTVMEEMLETLKATLGHLEGRIRERALAAIKEGDRALSLLEDEGACLEEEDA